MKKLSFAVSMLALALTALCSATTAQNAPAAGTSATFDFRATAIAQLKEARQEIVSLAEAMPPEKYTWRPAEGVRSVSEVYLHIAAGNFGLASLAGVPSYPGFKFQGFEKSTTDKAKVIELLNQSFDYAQNGISKLTDGDLQKQVNFQQYPTAGDVIFHLVSHDHEHLGQSIAYARMNGVVPPWTAEQMQKRAAASK
jgi:uncharacterized damage-inducible protein DinB